MARSVQFLSPEEVLQAYQNRKVAPWAIFHEKQFMFKYDGLDLEEGYDLLEQTLIPLQRSAATYTLCLYEDLPKVKGNKVVIKSNTPHDGSFNFKLSDTSVNGNFVDYRAGGGYGKVNELLSEVRALKMEIEQMKSMPDEEEEEEPTIGEAVQQSLTDALPTLLPALIGRLFGSNNQAEALAGVPDQVSNLSDALAVLRSLDPAFESHMMLLAQKAKEDPEKIRGIIKMIGLL